MNFNNLVKLSFIAISAINLADAADAIALSGVEVTGMGGVQVRLMTSKFQPEMLV